LELYRNSPVDIILLDYLLPDMDGLELLNLLMQQDEKPQVPVLMLTGHGNEAIATQVIKNGAQDYLIKDSLTADILCKTVIHAIEQFQLQQQLMRQQQLQRIAAEMALNIRQSLNLNEVLQRTVDEVRQFLQVDRVIIFQFGPDWGGTVAVESVINETLAIFPFDIHDPCIGKQYVEPFQQGLVTAKADIYNADISPCHVEFLAQFHVRANLVVPILKNNVLWGLLAAHHCTAPRLWQDTEIDLLRQLASHVSIALQQAELFEQVQTELIERKQAEVSLQQSEARLRLALLASNSAVWDWDISTNTLTWPPEYYQLYGLDPTTEATYENWLNCIHPDDRERASQQTLQALNDPLSELRVEFRVTRKNEIRWFAGIGQAFYDESGRPSRMAGITIDITTQKQTEIALQQLNADLEQRIAERTEELSNLNYRLLTALKEQHQAKQDVEDLYNNAPCGYHSLDVNGTIVRINDTELSWLGYTRDEVLNNMKFIDLITPDSQQSFSQNFPQFLRQGWMNDLEFQLRHKDGSTRWVSVNAVAIKDHAGNFLMSRSSLFDITDRKQVEQTLALQAVIARNMAEGVCLVRADDATIVYTNPKFEQMFGYDSGELQGQHVSILNYATESVTAEDVNQSIRSTVLLNGEATYEVHNVKKDSTPFWCSATCSVFQHPDYGNVLVAVHQDITERKQAEAALQQQTRLEQLRWKITQTIRQSLDLNAILNTTANQLRHTLQVDRVAVYRFQPNWSGDFIAESVSDEWVKLVESNIPKVWEDTYLQETQGERFQRHEPFVIPDIYTAGLQSCHIELLEQFQAKAYAVVPIFSGEALWGLLAIYQNSMVRDWQPWEIELLQQISNQLAIALHQSELYSQLQLELHEREQTEAVLREAERRWRSLLDNVQLIVIGLDHYGHVEYANPFFLKLTGYPLEEVLGKSWFDHFLSRSQGRSTKLIFQEVLEHDLHSHYQNPIVTKAGEDRMIAWSNTVLQDTSGHAIGTISIGEDITERYRVDRMKAEFISVVSHELRTPLTSMQAALSLLNDKIIDPTSEEGETTIQIATEGTDRLVRLVNDILDLERLESGKMRLEKRLLPISELVNTAIAQMQEMANQTDITLNATPCHVEAEVDGDRLLQVLTNLLSNAIKFSPSNSVIRLSVTQQFDEDSQPILLFKVWDQGRGIPVDKLESIFDRFHQVDASDSREKGGTGLGLAICRNIVQQHGGEIWVESRMGQGSLFYFTIPIVAERP
jgi:PAS domain S-box-containing protein